MSTDKATLFEMLLVLSLVVVTVVSGDVHEPRISQLPSGEVEIAIEGPPDVEWQQVRYTIEGVQHSGVFHKSPGGHFYHHKQDAGQLGGKVHYTLVGEKDRQMVVVDGFRDTAPPAMILFPHGRPRRAEHRVMRDDFDGGSLNRGLWDLEHSMYGGYNGEFQVYGCDPKNVFLRDGHLFIKPTLTSEKYGEAYLHSGTMDMAQMCGSCTVSGENGCHRNGHDGILPPVMSGKLKSKNQIRFGRVTVRARTPRGDWLWPAIWMLPGSSAYGGWPRSGEIDMMESKGNTGFNNAVETTLHWGPDPNQNRFSMTHASKQGSFAQGMHTYVLDWTMDHIKVSVDDQQIFYVAIGNGGFWQKGGFSGANIWQSGTKMAPFDHHFYLILNVAVGGTKGWWSDSVHYNSHKPWNNHQSQRDAQKSFWDGRSNWQGSWHGDDVAMEVDYVEMVEYS
ncbi:beta-1,3-glucan-binding protein-like isoform X2 [Dreissena polymorpha]|nr:beta-1,3-glucan-binding protein-like isoform X2 [Dreissena polymorpha]